MDIEKLQKEEDRERQEEDTEKEKARHYKEEESQLGSILARAGKFVNS